MPQVPRHGRSRSTHRRSTRVTHDHGAFEPPLEGAQSGVDQTVIDGIYGEQNLMVGAVGAGQIRDSALVISKFTQDLRPVAIVDVLPTLPDPNYPPGSTVVLTTDGKLYRNDADVWTAAVGSVDGGVEVLGSLPTLPDAGYPVGSVIFLTSDGKLYRNVSNVWTRTTPTTDLTGQITETQITDDAITTPKIAANAVTAGEIAANAVTADKILAGAVTAGKIAADAVTANEILAGSIGVSELAADSVTAAAIAAGAVSASEIAAGAIHVGHMIQPPNNLWINPGVEYVVSGQPTGWEALSNAAVDSSVFHSGLNSIKFTQPGTPVLIVTSTNRFNAQPNKRYLIKGWVRGLGTNGAGIQANLRVRNYDETGTLGTTSTVATTTIGANTTWQQISAVITTDADCVQVDVAYRSPSSGAAAGDVLYFDDGEFYPADQDVNHAAGNVQIDSTGITITDGRLLFVDEQGSTALTGTGFGHNWWRHIHTGGIFNGDIRHPTPTPANDIDNSTNPFPYWSFVKSSGTAITAKVVSDSNQASGWRVTFSMASGAAGDYSYIEQTVPILSSRNQAMHFRAVMGYQTGSSPTAAVPRMNIAFLKDDLSVINNTTFDGVANNTLGANFLTENSAGYVAPTNAAYMRIRFGLARGGAATSATDTINVMDMYIITSPSRVYVPDIIDPTTYEPGRIIQANGDMDIEPVHNSATASVLNLKADEVFSYGDFDVVSPMAYLYAGRREWIPGRVDGWLYDNLAASLTDAQMGRFDATQTNIFQRSPIMGRAGNVVGVCWRKSAAITAGTADLRLSVAGGASQSMVVLDSGSGNSGTTTFAPFSFTSGSSLTVQITTNGAYTPATLDYAVDLLVEWESPIT